MHLSLAATALGASPEDELRTWLGLTPDDHAAHCQLAAVLLAADDFEGAMSELLHLAKQGRPYPHDIGRISLLALFDLLGSAHPLTQKFRQALGRVLH